MHIIKSSKSYHHKASGPQYTTPTYGVVEMDAVSLLLALPVLEAGSVRLASDQVLWTTVSPFSMTISTSLP